jgi:PilZ domain
MTTLNQWSTWIKKLGYAEKPRAERRIPSGFAARLRNKSASKPATIRDISSTGLHILTEERWTVGELIPLIVQVERVSADPSEPRIEVDARVVRHCDDGIALSFVLPPGLDPNLWDVLLRNAVLLTQTHEILHTVRMLQTILFLCRLCQAQAHDAILLFGGELDHPRTEKAMWIAHRAEKLLASQPHPERMRAHPRLVASILKHGSWTDDFTEHLWAGLLASSCKVEGADESNSVFVDLLINFTFHQSRIFVAGSIQALELMSGTEKVPSTRIVLTPEQMIRLTGMYDLSRLATAMSYLFTSGVLAKQFDLTSYMPMDTFDITPTRLGLDLFQLCQGLHLKSDISLDLSQSAHPSLRH